MKRRVAVVVMTSLCLAGCQAVNSRSAGKKEEAPAAPRSPLEVRPAAAILSQMKIGQAGWAEVSESLLVPGRVDVDETRVARVGSPVTGRVTELEVMEGQEVRRGQVLATLHSTQLSDSQFGYLKALSQQQLLQRAVTRARQLVGAGVLGEAELQRREAELSQATAELSSSRDELKVLGVSEQAVAKLEATRTVNSQTQVVASIDGIVLERKVTVGQVAQPADTMFVVADLSNVWLVADVPEQHAGILVIGKSIEAEIPALPEQVVRGKLTFVSAIVNPETRTVRVRLDLANADRRYKPAMLANIRLQDRPRRQAVIPTAAVVRESNHDHIFVQTGASVFLLREVSLGGEFGEKRVLLEGLAPGEKIVVDGAFHLNNERKRLLTQGE